MGYPPSGKEIEDAAKAFAVVLMTIGFLVGSLVALLVIGVVFLIRWAI